MLPVILTMLALLAGAAVFVAWPLLRDDAPADAAPREDRSRP